MAFVAVLLGGGTAACGKDTEKAPAKEDSAKATPAMAVAEAARNTADITSLSYRIVGSVPEKGRLSAEASMNTEPLAMSMNMNVTASSQMEIRFVDEVIYVGGSAVASEKLNGARWFRAAPAVWGRGAVDNNTYAVVPRQIEGSPVLQSTILTGSKDVRSIGAETIDGTRTTHYRGTVTGNGLSVARNAAKDQVTRERQIESLDQFIALSLDNALTMDLWIDGDNHAKQFRMRGSTDGEPLDTTITFLEINQPVVVETPPANDTADIAALAAGAEAG